MTTPISPNNFCLLPPKDLKDSEQVKGYLSWLEGNGKWVKENGHLFTDIFKLFPLQHPEYYEAGTETPAFSDAQEKVIKIFKEAFPEAGSKEELAALAFRKRREREIDLEIAALKVDPVSIEVVLPDVVARIIDNQDKSLLKNLIKQGLQVNISQWIFRNISSISFVSEHLTDQEKESLFGRGNTRNIFHYLIDWVAEQSSSQPREEREGHFRSSVDRLFCYCGDSLLVKLLCPKAINHVFLEVLQKAPELIEYMLMTCRVSVLQTVIGETLRNDLIAFARSTGNDIVEKRLGLLKDSLIES
jgi:hypothetical protein